MLPLTTDEIHMAQSTCKSAGPLPRRPAGDSLVTHVWIGTGIEVHL